MSLVEGAGHPDPIDLVLGFGQRVVAGPPPDPAPVEAHEDLDSSSAALSRIDADSVALGFGEGVDLSIGVEEAGSLVVDRAPIELQAEAQLVRKAVLEADSELVRTVGREELLLAVSDLELVESVGLVVAPPARA